MENSEASCAAYAFLQRELPLHQRKLRAYALRLVKNPDDADDLLQEVFLKAFRFFPSFDGDRDHLSKWLYVIMKNHFLSQCKRSGRESERVDLDVALQEVNGDVNKLSGYDLSDKMLATMNSLPEKMRVVMFLCDIEGYSYQEIADELRINVGTVRSRLHRARLLARQYHLGVSVAPIRRAHKSKTITMPKPKLRLWVEPPHLPVPVVRVVHRRVKYPLDVLSMVG